MTNICFFSDMCKNCDHVIARHEYTFTVVDDYQVRIEIIQPTLLLTTYYMGTIINGNIYVWYKWSYFNLFLNKTPTFLDPLISILVNSVLTKMRHRTDCFWFTLTLRAFL